MEFSCKSKNPVLIDVTLTYMSWFYSSGVFLGSLSLLCRSSFILCLCLCTNVRVTQGRQERLDLQDHQEDQ